MRRPARAAALLLALLPACAFTRSEVNPQFDRLDTSKIRVGQSTWMDVLERLGPPTPPNSETIGREGASLRFFRYPHTQQRVAGFTFPVALILPFRWTDDVLVSDTVIEFDEAGLVKSIYQSGQDGIWRPIQDDDDREPGWTGRVEGDS